MAVLINIISQIILKDGACQRDPTWPQAKQWKPKYTTQEEKNH